MKLGMDEVKEGGCGKACGRGSKLLGHPTLHPSRIRYWIPTSRQSFSQGVQCDCLKTPD
jgi:hypothetical protein